MRYEGYFIRAGLSFVREVEEARHGRTVGTRDPPPPQSSKGNVLFVVANVL